MHLSVGVAVKPPVGAHENAPEKAGRFYLPLLWVVANALEKRADFICPYIGLWLIRPEKAGRFHLPLRFS